MISRPWRVVGHQKGETIYRPAHRLRLRTSANPPNHALAATTEQMKMEKLIAPPFGDHFFQVPILLPNSGRQNLRCSDAPYLAHLIMEHTWALLSMPFLCCLGQRLLLVQTTHFLPQRIFAYFAVVRNQDEDEKATLPDPKATFPDQKATFADHVLARF